MCQLDGFQAEDPYGYLTNFLEICDTVKANNVSEDMVHLQLFPFFMQGKAKKWLSFLQVGSIWTRAQLANKYLTRYFPPTKITKLQNGISFYRHLQYETLYGTLERYKDMLRTCPQHGIIQWMYIQIFYNGLNVVTMQMLKTVAEGSLYSKQPYAALNLIDEMDTNRLLINA